MSKKKPTLYKRSFLKWAGSKYRILPKIIDHFENDDILVEPFVGAGSVFLNTNYKKYILADINQDLINLYKIIQQDVDNYIKEAIKLFTEETNQKDFYYQIRNEFNQSTDNFQKAVYFLYLNRHGFNGLCRYNLKNQYNVPFGKYVKPYFPHNELLFFAEKSQIATFLNLDFKDLFNILETNCTVYCDPPYAPIIEQITNFTSYNQQKFSLLEQQLLADLAEKIAKKKKIKVIISNHDTKFTRDIYQAAKIKLFDAPRFISRHANKRKKVKELLATYQFY